LHELTSKLKQKGRQKNSSGGPADVEAAIGNWGIEIGKIKATPYPSPLH